jgi:4'-phosphopantetheinyl transferase
MCFLLRLDCGNSNTHLCKPLCSKPLLCSFTSSVISKPVDSGTLLRLDGILPDEEVHVWQVDQLAWERKTGALFELLDSEERERAARFKFPEPRNQFVISRALLRQCLGRYLHIEAREVRFRTTANGKPELAGNADQHLQDSPVTDFPVIDPPISDLRFNLSHTHGVTVFAVTRHRQVGVDVERIRQNTNALELAERFFSRPEVQWLRSQPASEHIPSFFSCWTAKEAYIKAHGQGMSMSLSSFGVLPVVGAADSKLQLSVYDDPQESRRWSIWRLDLGSDLRAALAVEGESCGVRLGQWPSPDVDANQQG